MLTERPGIHQYLVPKRRFVLSGEQTKRFLRFSQSHEREKRFLWKPAASSKLGEVKPGEDLLKTWWNFQDLVKTWWKLGKISKTWWKPGETNWRNVLHREISSKKHGFIFCDIYPFSAVKLKANLLKTWWNFESWWKIGEICETWWSRCSNDPAKHFWDCKQFNE